MRAALTFHMRRYRSAMLIAGAGLLAMLLLFAARTTQAVAPVPAPVAAAETFVVAAQRSIPAGVVIKAGDLRLKRKPQTASANALSSTDNAIGNISAHNLAAGDILSPADLRPVSEAGIAAKVASGQRAFSIRVAEDEIVGGFLQSGDHVDVFAVIPGTVFAQASQSAPDRTQSVLLLQNIPVLAVGQNDATKGAIQSGARTVSLSLAPEDMPRLTLAQRFGKVALAIRAPGDNSLAKNLSASLKDIVPENSSPVPQKSAENVRPSGAGSGIPFYSGTRVTTARRVQP